MTKTVHFHQGQFLKNNTVSVLLAFLTIKARTASNANSTVEFFKNCPQILVNF